MLRKTDEKWKSVAKVCNKDWWILICISSTSLLIWIKTWRLANMYAEFDVDVTFWCLLKWNVYLILKNGCNFEKWIELPWGRLVVETVVSCSCVHVGLVGVVNLICMEVVLIGKWLEVALCWNTVDYCLLRSLVDIVVIRICVKYWIVMRLGFRVLLLNWCNI